MLQPRSQTGLAPRFVQRPRRARLRLDAVRIPSAQVRRLKAPKPPTAVEHFLALATRKLVASYLQPVIALALKAVDDFAGYERTDAKDPLDKPRKEVGLTDNRKKAAAVSSHMRTVARRALKLGLPQFESRSKQAADRARAHSKNELGRLGLVVKKEPELRHLIDGWRKDNVARITGLSDEHIDRIERTLAEGFNKHPDTIEREIKRLGIMGDRRAELIARDQVLTLNAQINRYRQAAAGVTSYVWTTQNDDRVRDEHDEIDGEEFTWEDGHPDEGHPGEPVNCRCMAFPIEPEKGAEEEEPEEAEPDEDAETDEE